MLADLSGGLPLRIIRGRATRRQSVPSPRRLTKREARSTLRNRMLLGVWGEDSHLAVQRGRSEGVHVRQR